MKEEHLIRTGDTLIHPTAMVAPGAQLGVGVSVGPYATVGPKVVLGDRVQVKSHAMVQGRTFLGADTIVYSFATIGSEPQDRKYRGEDSKLHCGEGNKFREYSNVSIGTDQGGGITRIGSHNLFMVYSHVAHDCIVGSHCTVANGVSLAGHVEVNDGAVIGGHVAVHQFVRIGSLVLVAGGAVVVQDVAPYCIVHGDHARPRGINIVGLKRADSSKEDIENLRRIYRLYFMSHHTQEEALAEIRQAIPQSAVRDEFVNFVVSSKRGICRRQSGA